MSQDQPNPPQPARPAPQTPAPQPPRNRSKSFVKAGSIKVLRATINFLEGVVVKLETEQPEPTVSLLDKFRTALGRLWNGWVPVLGRIRSVLPESLNQKLPDWGLTGAIAGILVLVLWTTTTLRSGRPAEVAKVPPPEPAQVSEVPPPEPAPPTSVPTPPELTAPEPPTLVETLPPPEPELTPEQSLIASIQAQVAEVTTDYADGLIKSIQANFESSLLIVKISDEWYNLNPSRQNKLAGEILSRSRELDFRTLEIADSEGTLLARSPVVGSEVVIFNRSKGAGEQGSGGAGEQGRM